MNKCVYIDLVWAKQQTNTFKQRSNYTHKFMSILPAGVSLRQNQFTSIHMDTYTLLSDKTPTSSWEQPCLIIQLHLLLWRWHKSLKALWPWHSVCERLRQNRIHVRATTDVLLFKVSVLQHNCWIENHWNNSLSSLIDPHMTVSTECSLLLLEEIWQKKTKKTCQTGYI